MFEPDQLRANERDCKFRYPAGFLAIAPKLELITGSEGFAAAFPGGRLASAGDISAAWAGCLPKVFVPFMLEDQPECTDYYCFADSEEGHDTRVVVFTDHSVVHDWPTFDAFLAWAQQVCAAEPPS